MTNFQMKMMNSIFLITVQFCSRWHLWLMHSEKPICHSEVSPMLPLKWFQCLIDDGPLLSFQGRSSSTSSLDSFHMLSVVSSYLVSDWILTSCLPHRVTSGQLNSVIRHKQMHIFKTLLTYINFYSC